MKVFPNQALYKILGKAVLYSFKPVNLNYVANMIANKKWSLKEGKKLGLIVDKYNELILTSKKGDLNSDFIVFKSKGGLPELEKYVDKTPRIIIDLRFSDLLLWEEKRSLMKQLIETKNVIRKYYWENVFYLRGNLPFEERKNEFQFIEEIENPIVLDPYGEEELKKFDWNASYIVGGIVDKGNRLKGLTSKIEGKRVSIKLRGKTLGVPYTINKIIEILCKLMEGKEIEEAILEVSPPRFLKQRLNSELSKKEKDWELIDKLKSKLNYNP